MKNLKLTKDEEKIIDYSKTEVEDSRARAALAVAGGVVMDKSLGFGGF